jgi:hypothetical protein
MVVDVAPYLKDEDFDKSHHHQAGSVRRLVVAAVYQL